MKKLLFFIALAAITAFSGNAQNGNELPFQTWALTPPMGWNSWDCFGPSVVESEVKANADYMATNLKDFGWEYIVVDIRWYVDNQTTGHYNDFNNSTFIYDEYGRYMPSPTRFPSAVNGAGFKPLADYIHSQGLKFGIHIMRGVPKVAVTNNLPIKNGNGKTAADIYSTASECTWLHDNYTIDATKDGAQEYYNSIMELYASWGGDFIKIDDLSRPYHQDEIELIRNAIDQTGRPIVLSMSPGATPLDKHEHAKNHANMWRTVDDFWDNWSQLNYSFGMCAKWAPYISPGTWPDADMLPMGKFIRGERATNRYTNFTHDEQYTLMTLWSIFKSPLMFGGNLPDNDNFTDSLITNNEVLDMHKTSVNNNEWFNENDVIAWTADDPRNGDKYVALFNNGGDGFVKSSNLIYRSGTISRLTDGYGIGIDIEIPVGSNELYLVVNDDGDGYGSDHADWISPTIYYENGDSTLLTNLEWEYASSGWGTVQKNKSISGGTLNIKGTTYDNGIGTHAQSVILFQIPDSCIRFKAFAGLDIGGTDQTGGATVEFMLALQAPTVRDVNPSKAIANSGRISRTMQAEGVNLEADITNATKLYLVVTDAGDNYNYDHGDWINPAIYNANGDSILLTSLTWVSATSGWGQVKKNTSLDGNPLKVNGVSYANGFGLNSYSTIEFDLPAGYTTFKSFCGVDDEVLNAPNGVTIEFMVFTENPENTSTATIPVNLNELGFEGECTIRDMWQKSDLGTFSGTAFAPTINNHGAGLYKVSAVNRSNETSVNLSTSSQNEINVGDTLKLEIEVSKTGSATAQPTGSIALMQNDTVVATIQLDSVGNATFASSSLKAGQHTFTANYGGNTIYSPNSSNQVSISVKEISTAVSKVNTPIKITVITLGGEKFLHGTVAGDIVSIYDIQGRLVENFISRSDMKRIDTKGFVVIKVQSSGYCNIIKTYL